MIIAEMEPQSKLIILKKDMLNHIFPSENWSLSCWGLLKKFVAKQMQ
jgi:hypothetical protein